DDQPGDRAVDGEPPRRDSERVIDRVQRDDVDAICGDSGSTPGVLPIGTLRARSAVEYPATEACVRTGRLVRSASADVWIPPCLHVAFGRCGDRGAAGGLDRAAISPYRRIAAAVGRSRAAGAHAVSAAVS